MSVGRFTALRLNSICILVVQIVTQSRTEALLLKEEIDRGVRPPRHDTVETVCIYLLKTRGYQPTVSWVEGVYGDNFLPTDTEKQLERIIREQSLTVEIPTEYNHDSRD